MNTQLALLALSGTLALLAAQDQTTTQGDTAGLRLEAKISIGNVSGRIDHMAIDLTRQRLFVAELGNNTVGVVDLNGRNVGRGEYVELDPPSRVVFTFGWEGGTSIVKAGESTVEVTLTADGVGTLLRLAHRDLPEVSRDSHGHGWEHYLQRLEVAGAGGDPGEDPWSDPARAGS